MVLTALNAQKLIRVNRTFEALDDRWYSKQPIGISMDLFPLT